MLREVTVENGRIRGVASADPRVTAFKGIPFAAPPVGENRWRAPRPAENWEGTRLCQEFAPISVQDRPGVGNDLYCREWHVDPDIPMDEDCLYLNVWTGARSADEKLPVLVWYFGGGFQWGYTSEMEFDGERLARRGVVVVSVNYRLAALGFLAHPDITKESPETPGNFGLLDQKAGLDWVVRNIAAFGGDPDRITIAGQSAGGASTMEQLTCRENFDKIKGAAIFSGMIRDTRNIDPLTPKSLREAEQLGVEFFRFLGVKTLDEARKLDAFFIRDRYAKYAEKNPRFFAINDGKVYTGDPYTDYIDNEMPDVPVMAGYTSDEFVENGVNIVKASVINALNEARKSGRKSPQYLYRFCPELPGYDDPGVFHSSDLWFWFENANKCWRPFTGHHFELARTMCDYFANFIKTGDPNGAGIAGDTLPVWKAFGSNGTNEIKLK